MKFWTQNSKFLNPISEWGCYYISLVNLAQLITGKEFTDRQIVTGWNLDLHDGDIDMESTILDPAGVLEGFGAKVEFVGKKPAEYLCKADEYEILEFYNRSTNMVHFVLGDRAGKCMIDPYPNSKTVRFGFVRSKRIFRRK